MNMIVSLMASGAKNWIVSADSDAIQKYPPERRENGLLISRDWR